METRGWMLLRALLGRYHKGDPETALQILTEEEARKIREAPAGALDPKLLFLLPQHLLEKIHYSWLEPLLKELPKEQRLYYLAALGEKSRSKLQEKLGLPKEGLRPSRLAKAFFQGLWFQLLKGGELLPAECIRDEPPINRLVAWDKEGLLDLIDLLSLFDLSQEIPYIVDKRALKKIYGSLEPLQRLFFKEVLNRPPKWKSAPLGLERGGWGKKELLRALHLRGMERLALALLEADPLANWYVLHTLDSGRGRWIEKRQAEEEGHQERGGLQSEVVQAIQFIRGVKK